VLGQWPGTLSTADNRKNFNDQSRRLEQFRRLEEGGSPQQAPWHVEAEKLGITGRDAEAYSDALAVGTLDPERSDVLSKIREDFDAAGVVQSDEQILRVMNELTLQAGNQMPVTPGGGPDALAVMLARQLKSQ
jgi:hypothetical protein